MLDAYVYIHTCYLHDFKHTNNHEKIVNKYQDYGKRKTEIEGKKLIIWN